MNLLQQTLSPDTLQSVQTASFELFEKLSNKFFVRLFIDLLSVFVLIRLIFYRNYKKADQYLTFFAFNLVIFLITYLLNKVEMSMGAAFGLFAVFSMLRYRTESISPKDMTYLFLVIAIGLLSAISKGGWDELTLLNGIILLATFLLESNWLIKKEFTKSLIYDNINLITPERRSDLLEDLKKRTGLNIHRVEIQEIDFLKDATRMTIYYFD
ncbi:hypothetical protein Emtol_0904 [Emticicia oligotrophica DSM 17448]|uniref:DUF4956 domain-containing protein n=1 Tax=Emticicia oligotrophica (strain DSM 17448 / CIP 109782 / MTCC 6937 / GPTSA100-15) TaxID=929562 RepID=A0ABN4AJ18_EMTOG|nr:MULTISPECIES: DUF4956 domain-containing protein [Emticicia]AFK02055.1 hypothetical protein Emtol_0904 [Emticicia oligotrophica DSM 17448]